MTEEKRAKSKRQKVTLELPSEEEKKITSSLLSRLLGTPPMEVETSLSQPTQEQATPVNITPVLSTPVQDISTIPPTVPPKENVIISEATSSATIAPAITSPAITTQATTTPVTTTPVTTTPVITTPVNNSVVTTADRKTTGEEITPVTITPEEMNQAQPAQVKITPVTTTPVTTTPVTAIPENKFPGKRIPENDYTREIATPVLNTWETEYRGNSLSEKKSARDNGYHTPNWLDDEIMPLLQLSEQVVLRRLFRLSYGFNRQITDSISIPKLAEKCNLSEKGVKLAVKALEEKGYIIVHRDLSGNKYGGNKYEVLTRVINTGETDYPRNQLPQKLSASIIDHDHDLKIHDHDLGIVMRTYSKLTGKNWTKADQRAYEQINQLPAEQLAAEMHAISERSSAPIGSFQYFVTSIKNAIAEGKGTGQAGQSAARRRIEEWAAQLRQTHVGDGSYSISDLSADLKDRCAREGIEYTAELINEIISRK